MCMRRHARFLAILAPALLASCGDSAPVGVPPRCIGTCVVDVDVTPQLLALTPGDTAQLDARAITAAGQRVGVQWSSLNGVLATDSAGRVTATTPGKGRIYATAATDSTKIGVSEIWVVHPDTASQPFIAAFRDAVSGEPLVRWRGFAGRDSVRLTLSYVVGWTTETHDAPALRFEIRPALGSTPLFVTTVPVNVRGRGALTDLIVHLTRTDSKGVRLFPPGAYDFYVLLPLADGRVLGSQTGYHVTF